MSIGENIKRIRTEKNMSQDFLAYKVGISQSMLCSIEKNTKIPSLPAAKNIADALECSLEDFFAL